MPYQNAVSKWDLQRCMRVFRDGAAPYNSAPRNPDEPCSAKGWQRTLLFARPTGSNNTTKEWIALARTAGDSMILASTKDFRRAAERRIPRFLFDYIDGGAYDEHTMGKNVSDLTEVALRQRVLRDVSQIE